MAELDQPEDSFFTLCCETGAQCGRKAPFLPLKRLRDRVRRHMHTVKRIPHSRFRVQGSAQFLHDFFLVSDAPVDVHHPDTAVFASFYEVSRYGQLTDQRPADVHERLADIKGCWAIH